METVNRARLGGRVPRIRALIGQFGSRLMALLWDDEVWHAFGEPERRKVSALMRRARCPIATSLIGAPFFLVALSESAANS
jgi:sirohydrochlorin ferrochelatase